jgi:hypothetical protein
MPVFCRENLECSTCPGAKYGSNKHEDGTFTPDITTALSNCVWKETWLPAEVPTSNPNVDIIGSYTGICHLQGDTQKGCKLPDTCADTTVHVQGNIYFVKQAVRVGPLVEYGLTPGCPSEGLPPTCRDSATAPGIKQARCRRGGTLRSLFDSNSLPTGKGRFQPEQAHEPEYYFLPQIIYSVTTLVVVHMAQCCMYCKQKLFQGICCLVFGLRSGHLCCLGPNTDIVCHNIMIGCMHGC